MKPIISTIIPTLNRPQIVERAVKSVLAQTFNEIEVIVIIDGPDEATRVVLSKIDDPRLRVVELPLNQGASGARNAGIFEAAGEWIAFLDDDDEWLPHKLEVQMEFASRSHCTFPVVACRLIARTPKGEFIWPRTLPTPSKPLSEYLLARNTLFQGEGLIQTSMLLTKKDLLQKLPFRSDLPRHEDRDWLLRVSTLEDVEINFVPEPLTIWYVEERRKSLSSTSIWRNSLAWIQENRNLVTSRAYSSFILVEVGSQASQEGEFRAFLPVLWEAIRHGRPKPIDFLLCLGMWLIPQQSRRTLRRVFNFKRNQSIKSA